MLIVTDREPQPEALEDLSFLPQAVLVLAEHRDLVKLLVISQAKRKGVEIDSSLLLRAYENILEKFNFNSRIGEWIKKMAENGYLLSYEGFIERTALACQFFINTIGTPLTLQETWEKLEAKESITVRSKERNNT